MCCMMTKAALEILLLHELESVVDHSKLESLTNSTVAKIIELLATACKGCGTIVLENELCHCYDCE